MMNNLRRFGKSSLLQQLRSNGQVGSCRVASSASPSALALSQAGLAFPKQSVQRAFYHNSTVCHNEQDNKGSLSGFFTDEVIAEMEYHHEQRDVADLNLFLRHPSSPRLIGWHPDLIYDDDMTENDSGTADSPSVADESVSCMNRNARYGTKASKGKRPVSRQARRRKKRSIGNHRR